MITVSELPIINAKPMIHQVAAFDRGMELFHNGSGYALFHDPGCGKTLTAIALAAQLYREGEVQKVLVVSPVSVMSVWPMEFEKFCAEPHRVHILKGKNCKDKGEMLLSLGGHPGLTVAVINYESSWRILDYLMRWKPDMLICDESQRVKNHRANQSKALHTLGIMCPYRMIMTGTPINNTPLDYWSQYKIIAPRIFAPNFYGFRSRYAVMGGFEGKEIIRYQNLDELAQKAHSVAHRVTKEEALDLPEYVDQVITMPLEPKARRIYDQLRRQAAAELENEKRITADMMITKLLRLRQLTGGFIQPDETEQIEVISQAKLDTLSDLLIDLLDNPDRKVVIFANFVPEIKAIVQRCCSKYGVEAVRAIWGDIPQKDRGPYVDEFQNDPQVRIFVAQTRTAGLGLTLHAADTCIFYSMDYSFGDYDQALARIHRSGQDKSCTAIHLLAENTIDKVIFEMVHAKAKMADLIVDNWHELLGGVI